jgi:hypothetical protein
MHQRRHEAVRMEVGISVVPGRLAGVVQGQD